MKTSRSTLFGFLLLSWLVSFGAFAAAPAINDIGTLGGTYSYAQATSDSGDVVGQSDTSGNAATHAFLWNAASGMHDLGTLGGSYSQAIAVNNHGEVIGHSQRADGSYGGFYWSAATGMVDLGTIGDGQYVYPSYINDNGQVTGQIQGGSYYYRTFFWTRTSGMQDISPNSTCSNYYYYYCYSVPQKLNSAGQVLGYYFDGYTSGSFVFTPANGTTVLSGGLSTSGGYSYVYGQDQNNSGAVTGYSYTNEGTTHAFVWTADAGYTDLGTLGNDPYGYSYGYSINDSGTVVGQTYDCSTYQNLPFVWNAADGMQSILLPAGYDQSGYLYELSNGGQALGYASGSTDGGYIYWDANTGAFGRLDIDPLPHQLHVARRVVTSGDANWLIADDVGLGKTIEVGLILHALTQRNRCRRVLVVCPASLTKNWKQEMRIDRKSVV